MPDVYACDFTVRVPSDGDAATAFATAIQCWVAEHSGEPSVLALDKPAVVRTDTGSLFRWEPFMEGDRCLLDFTWRHPDRARAGVSWATRATYLQLGAGAFLSLQVSNTGPEPDSPAVLLTTRPRLLLHLLEHVGLFSDGHRMAIAPELLDAQSIPSFVRYELLDPRRRIPVVVVTPFAGRDYPVDPLVIGSELVSLAKYYALTDAESSYVLTAELGRRQLSCFHGGLRVYFAGFSTEADPYTHPLLVRRRLEDPSQRMALCRHLALLATRRHVSNPAVAQLRDEREYRLALERSAVAADLEARRREAQSQADYEQLAQMAWDENEKLDTRLEELQARQDELTGKLQWMEREIRRLKTCLADAGEAEEECAKGEAVPGPEPADVLDAVETASELFADDLCFLPSAFDSARTSPFKRASDVLQALRTLAEVAALKQSGPLGQPLRDVLRERGLDYAAGLSETTPKKTRRKFRFSGDGGTIVCEEHLRLGSNSYDPAECLRIHISTAERPDGKIVVGYVGRHLDVVTTT